MKTKKIDKAELKKLVLSIVITLLVTLSLITINANVTIDKQREQLGIKAVKSLYQFNDLQQLQINMGDLKAITTDAVYNQLTIDNEGRALATYVKFYGDKTSVNVIKSSSNYVLYSLTNTNIDPDTIYIFMFECNRSGKISYAREATINDFVTYAD